MKTLEEMKVLLCAPCGIGDLVMHLPLVDALRAHYPHAHITLLGARPAIEVLRRSNAVDTIICLNDWGIKQPQDEADPLVIRRVEHWFANQHFDLVFDALATVPFVRDIIFHQYRETRERDQSTQRQVLRDGGTGLQAICASARVGWGVPISADDEPRIEITEEERLAGVQFLFERGITQRPRVAISPIASSNVRRWPVERLAAVGDFLLQEYGGKLPVLVGQQAEVGDELFDHMQRRDDAVIIGPLHLRHTAAILSHCDLLFCNHTGLMHLAAAVGTRVLVPFGPTSPKLYLPSKGHSISGDSTACPHRLVDRFGPDPCVAEGECRRATATCMARIQLAGALTSLHALLGTEKHSVV